MILLTGVGVRTNPGFAKVLHGGTVLEAYLDLQSTQSNGLYTYYFEMEAIVLGTLQVWVPEFELSILDCTP